MHSEHYKFAEILQEGITKHYTHGRFYSTSISEGEISIWKERITSYFFINNLIPYLNKTILLPIAEILANNNNEFKDIKSKYKINNSMSCRAKKEIDNIIQELYVGGNSNKQEEIERIRAVCRAGKTVNHASSDVDLLIRKMSGEVILIDIRSSTPRFINFVHYKRNILYWIATWLYQNPEGEINSMIAIPYNPYAPAPYERWTMKGMLDIENELLVAEEFWDFVAGEKVYEELLDCFERVGMRMRPEIEHYCHNLNK